MSRRTLHLVLGADEAGPPDPDVDVVVLDSSWTPAPGDRPDIAPIRPRLHAVLDRVDLFDGSLELLDAWAEATGLADRLVANDVTWWFRIRMVVRWDLHERMLWRYVLGDLLSGGAYARVVVPAERRALVDVARAAGSAAAAASSPIEIVEVTGPDDPAPAHQAAESRLPQARSEPALSFGERIARKRSRLIRRLLRQPPPPSARKLAAQRRAEAIRARQDQLDARVSTLAARPGGVLAIASANFFQVLGDGDRARFVDPHLALVLDRLEAEGTNVATAVLALDHRRDDHWPRIEADPHTIPDSYIKARWGSPDEATDETPRSWSAWPGSRTFRSTSMAGISDRRWPPSSASRLTSSPASCAGWRWPNTCCANSGRASCWSITRGFERVAGCREAPGDRWWPSSMGSSTRTIRSSAIRSTPTSSGPT